MSLTGEQGLMALLADDAAVSAFVGERIRPHVAPQTDAFPLITYKRRDAKHEHNMKGPSGLCQSMVEVSAFARSYADAISLREAIRKKLDGFNGLVKIEVDGISDDVTIRKCFLDSDSESYIEMEDGNQIGVYSVTMLFSMAYEE